MCTQHTWAFLSFFVPCAGTWGEAATHWKGLTFWNSLHCQTTLLACENWTIYSGHMKPGKCSPPCSASYTPGLSCAVVYTHNDQALCLMIGCGKIELNLMLGVLKLLYIIGAGTWWYIRTYVCILLVKAKCFSYIINVRLYHSFFHFHCVPRMFLLRHPSWHLNLLVTTLRVKMTEVKTPLQQVAFLTTSLLESVQPAVPTQVSSASLPW